LPGGRSKALFARLRSPNEKDRARCRARSREALEPFGHFNAVLTESNLVLSAVPTPFTAVMIAIAMPAACTEPKSMQFL
jgi:hypothetical protein